jgi:antibiotic biosynthesis monooxygenase (ABM) superfamily enzyme
MAIPQDSFTAKKESLETKALRATKVTGENKAIKDPPETWAPWVKRVLKGQRERAVLWAMRDRKVIREMPGHKESEETRDPKGPRDLGEMMAHVDFLAIQAREAHKAQRDPWDPKDPKEGLETAENRFQSRKINSKEGELKTRFWDAREATTAKGHWKFFHFENP